VRGARGATAALADSAALAALYISLPMRPIAFTYTGTVGVPIDEVFELLTDPTRMPEWLPSCTAAVPGPKRRGKGDRHRLHFERQGRKTDAVIEIIEYERPTSYGWVEIIHRLQARVPRRLHPHHHEAGLDAGELARLAARPVLAPPQRAQDVRWLAAEPAKGVDEIGGKGGKDGRGGTERWTSGSPGATAYFCREGRPRRTPLNRQRVPRSSYRPWRLPSP